MKALSDVTWPILDLKSGDVTEVTSSQLDETFAREGVIALPDFFSADELATVNAALDERYQELERTVLVEQMNSLAHEHKCDVIPWDPYTLGHEVFRDLHDHNGVHGVTEAVLGKGYTAPGSLVMFCTPGGLGQAWHQDCPDDDSRAFNLNRLIYTRDVHPEEGSIVFVPGSHRWGRIPPGGHQDPMEGEVVLSPKAGTLVFLHGHVYHRVTPNHTDRPRMSINFRAFPEGVPSTVTCIGVYRSGAVNFCDKPKKHDGTPVEVDS